MLPYFYLFFDFVIIFETKNCFLNVIFTFIHSRGERGVAGKNYAARTHFLAKCRAAKVTAAGVLRSKATGWGLAQGMRDSENILAS